MSDFQQPLVSKCTVINLAGHRANVLGIERDGVRIQIEGVKQRPLVEFADIEHAVFGVPNALQGLQS